MLARPTASRQRALRLLAAVLAGLALAACSSSQSGTTAGRGRHPGSTSSTEPTTSTGSTSSTTSHSTSSGQPLRYRHVFMVVMENLEYTDALATPGIATLAHRYAYLTDSYAAGHPSLPNYLAMTAGFTFGVTSDCLSCYLNAPNLGEQLSAAHVTWDAYFENVSQPCYLGTSYGEYAAKHNPFRYFDDIRSSPSQCAHLRPYSELPGLLKGPAAGVPRYVWVTPNICDDGHDCPPSDAAVWLSGFIRSVTASAAWRSGGLLVVTWDEGSDGDLSTITPAGTVLSSGGGGHILTVLVAGGLAGHYAFPLAPAALLAAIEENFGLAYLGGAATWRGRTLLDVIGRHDG